MYSTEMQSEDSNLGPREKDLQERPSRSTDGMPFVMSDLHPAHEAKRTTGARSPKVHSCRLRESLDNMRFGRFLENDQVGPGLADHSRELVLTPGSAEADVIAEQLQSH